MSDAYSQALLMVQAAGLMVDSIEVDGRIHRHRVDGEGHEKKGWYRLRAFPLRAGGERIVGQVGVWHAENPNTQKIDVGGAAGMDDDERAAVRAYISQGNKEARERERRQQENAARHAQSVWAGLAQAEPEGGHKYLRAKRVGAHGLRFWPSEGAAVVPMCGHDGRVQMLQLLRARPVPDGKRQKEYWPAGAKKKGASHLLGNPPRDAACIVVAEGYATAASIHEATMLPVAVAFDAGNLLPAALELQKRFKRARFIFAADDDAGQKCQACKQRVWLLDTPDICPHCGETHKARNAGVEAARHAAQSIGGQYLWPDFKGVDRRAAWLERGEKLTDFNDLHCASTLLAVRAQFEALLAEHGLDAASSARGAAPAGGPAKAEGAGEGGAARVVSDLGEMLERFVWVWGETNVFDRATRSIMSDAALRGLCVHRNIYRDWMCSADRAVVMPHEIGFDPTERDASIKCNTWGGWPTTPRAGSCEALLELLAHLCGVSDSTEPGAESAQAYQWVLRWLAYPIQHPGAKMKTALVVRGGQGTGKNMFFEAYAKIFARYAAVIDQSALERQFNSWISAKLLLICDEIVARSELWDVKNKLKGLITGDTVYVNPKGTAEREERNHANFIFLSNEIAPVPLEKDDRRHMVIAQKTPREASFYADVRAEIAAGGVAALHEYLLHLPLGDFHEGTPPLENTAKADAKDTVQNTPALFCEEFCAGLLEHFPGVAEQGFRCPLPSGTFYAVYTEWCARNGIKNKMDSRRFVAILKNECDAIIEKANYYDAAGQRRFASFVFLPGAQQMPPAASRGQWLGEWATYAEESAKQYRKLRFGAGGSDA